VNAATVQPAAPVRRRRSRLRHAVTTARVAWSGSPGWRRIRTVTWWVTCALLVALALACWPQKYGGTTSVTIVAGQSMEPTYRSGDLLLTRERSYEVGDAVVYVVPHDQPGAGHRVVHRLVGGDGDTGWVTQGDNNAQADIWTPRDADVVGEVVVHVPKAGFLLVLLRSPLTWALAGAVTVGRLLWPSGDDREDGAPASADAAGARMV